MQKKLEAFYRAYKKQWFTENKPHGFDVQEIRIGGLMVRVRSCAERLQEFYDGKIEGIEELEEKLLRLKEKGVKGDLLEEYFMMVMGEQYERID